MDLSKWTFWAFVNLINAIRVLLKIVSHHLFTEQFEPCIIIIDNEQSWLFIVLRQRFLFRKFLLFLKSIARETILEVLGFSWSDFYLFVVEATRNFVTGDIEANLLGMIELKDIKILFVYPEQVPIFKLNDRSISTWTTCDPYDDFISNHTDVALLAGDKRFTFLLNPHSVPFDLILRAFEKSNPLGRWLLIILRLIDYYRTVFSFYYLGFFDLSLEGMRGKQSSIL